jgi:hypothetical protein
MQFEVQSAALVSELEGRPPANLTPVQKRGLKYQAKVEVELERLYPGRVLLKPWFRYKINGVIHRCQPDAIIFGTSSGTAIAVEIKYSTVSEAWQKLSQVYAPVIAKAYRVPVSMVLITRIFDPHVKFECVITQLEGLERLDSWKSEGLGVVSWK